MSVDQVPKMPVCPDCATELSWVKRALWCWKCERYLRPGEDRAARVAAGLPPVQVRR